MDLEKYRKEIPMIELVEFCENYNAIGFGQAWITELKSRIIVKLYNVGYSENEEMDSEFKRKYVSCIILDRHPITIAEFSKLDLNYGSHIVDFDGVCDKHDCCHKQNNFSHTLTIE